jgi:hypothetical protein
MRMRFEQGSIIILTCRTVQYCTTFYPWNHRINSLFHSVTMKKALVRRWLIPIPHARGILGHLACSRQTAMFTGGGCLTMTMFVGD